jgi:glycosyltransferase involved in cell wall biosynthesis
MRLSKKLKAKLIFNVSDLWPESAEKMGIVTNKFFLKMAYNLEAKIYRKSFFISGQATGIVGSIKKRFPEKDVYWLSNGVDTKRIDPAKIEPYGLREKYNIPADHTVYFYGGILGHAQGLQIIINAAVSFKGEKATFVLMGSGPEKDDLLKLQKEVGADNVIFAEPVGRTEVANVLKEVDASIIPLRKLDVFEGVIPSKIFEVLAMQKPIILGVNGESKAFFIDEAKAGLHYEPENTEALVNAIRYSLDNPEEMIQFGKNGRSYVEEKFDRDLLVNNFYAYLKEKHEN